MITRTEISECVFIECIGKYIPADPGVWRYSDGTGQPPEPSQFDVEYAQLIFIKGEGSMRFDCPDELVDLFYDEIMYSADQKYEELKYESD